MPQGSCEFEAGARSGRGETEYVVEPGCNVLGPMEWALPLTASRLPGEPSSRSVGLDVKYVGRPVKPGGWGWGLAGGVAADVTSRPRAAGGEAKLIASVAPGERWAVHANLGAARARADTTRPTWALALEHAATETIALGVETFGERGSRPFFHVGVRVQVSKTVALDLSAGGQRGGSEAARFVSLGLTVSGLPGWSLHGAGR